MCCQRKVVSRGSPDSWTATHVRRSKSLKVSMLLLFLLFFIITTAAVVIIGRVISHDQSLAARVHITTFLFQVIDLTELSLVYRRRFVFSYCYIL